MLFHIIYTSKVSKSNQTNYFSKILYQVHANLQIQDIPEMQFWSFQNTSNWSMGLFSLEYIYYLVKQGISLEFLPYLVKAIKPCKINFFNVTHMLSLWKSYPWGDENCISKTSDFNLFLGEFGFGYKKTLPFQIRLFSCNTKIVVIIERFIDNFFVHSQQFLTLFGVKFLVKHALL